jgi:predicted nucleic acid-binding protein
VGVVLLDSSAVVGFLQPDDALHEAAGAAVGDAVRGGSFLAISAVTWTEVLTGAKLGHREEGIVRGFVTDFAVEILPVDAAVAERAAQLRARHTEPGGADGRRRSTLKAPDALILATADAHPDVKTVVGGDTRWARVCRSLGVMFARLVA